MTWCSIHRSPLGWLGNNCTGSATQNHGERIFFSLLKPSHLKSIHSQKVPWVKTLEVLLNFLALIGVLSSWMSGSMRERQISSSKSVGGVSPSCTSQQAASTISAITLIMQLLPNLLIQIHLKGLMSAL